MQKEGFRNGKIRNTCGKIGCSGRSDDDRREHARRRRRGTQRASTRPTQSGRTQIARHERFNFRMEFKRETRKGWNTEWKTRCVSTSSETASSTGFFFSLFPIQSATIKLDTLNVKKKRKATHKSPNKKEACRNNTFFDSLCFFLFLSVPLLLSPLKRRCKNGCGEQEKVAGLCGWPRRRGPGLRKKKRKAKWVQQSRRQIFLGPDSCNHFNAKIKRGAWPLLVCTSHLHRLSVFRSPMSCAHERGELKQFGSPIKHGLHQNRTTSKRTMNGRRRKLVQEKFFFPREQLVEVTWLFARVFSVQ